MALKRLLFCEPTATQTAIKRLLHWGVSEYNFYRMDYTHYLWDFNGTLYDDVDLGITSVNTLLKRRGLPIINNRVRYQELFDFPIIDYYRKLGFDFEKEPYDSVAHEWLAEYLRHSESAKLYDDIPKALKQVQKKGVLQMVLSMTERGMLLKQLTQLGILAYFDEVLGLDNIHAHSKIEIACRWAARVRPKRALLIGDTLHDAQTAAAAKFDCVLIARGHQSKSKLLTAGVPVYNSVTELCAALV